MPLHFIYKFPPFSIYFESAFEDPPFGLRNLLAALEDSLPLTCS